MIKYLPHVCTSNSSLYSSVFCPKSGSEKLCIAPSTHVFSTLIYFNILFNFKSNYSICSTSRVSTVRSTLASRSLAEPVLESRAKQPQITNAFSLFDSIPRQMLAVKDQGPHY